MVTTRSVRYQGKIYLIVLTNKKINKHFIDEFCGETVTSNRKNMGDGFTSNKNNEN